MVAEQSCVKRFWSIVVELCNDWPQKWDNWSGLYSRVAMCCKLGITGSDPRSAAGATTTAASMVDVCSGNPQFSLEICHHG